MPSARWFQWSHGGAFRRGTLEINLDLFARPDYLTCRTVTITLTPPIRPRQ
jgi:hypothetical protein